MHANSQCTPFTLVATKHRNCTLGLSVCALEALAFKETRPMVIERSGFLLTAAALAGGGVAGWALRDSRAIEHEPVTTSRPVEKSAEPVTPAVASAVPVVDPKVATAPACDDSVGVAEACPSVGPADEGVCANVIAKRCNDYKAAFKPKVAQAAVACLRGLQGAERCDGNRVNRCGHAALMAACPEREPPLKGNYLSATATTPASFTLTPDPAVTPSPLTTACENLVKSSAGHALSPTLADCRQTLAGMNEAGRAMMLECMATHGKTRGLLGCEAVQKDGARVQAAVGAAHANFPDSGEHANFPENE
jgi:hypothetical protein